MRVDIVGPTGLTDSELADAADLLARLVADGAALGWVDPPPPAEVAALLRAIWSAPPGEAALAVATDDADVAASEVVGVAAAGVVGVAATDLAGLRSTDVVGVAAADVAGLAATGVVGVAAADVVGLGAAGVVGLGAAGQVGVGLPIAENLPGAHRAVPGRLVGLAYWRRYERPTHRPHADVEKVAVAPEAQGRGIGRLLMAELIGAAGDAEIEVLTLDLRGDNRRALALYESLGFERYGRLPRFVAVGDRRWDKLFYALDLRVGLATSTSGRGTGCGGAGGWDRSTAEG